MTRRKLLGPSLAAVYMVFATGAAIMSTVREVTGPRFESVALLIPSTCFALVGALIIVRGSRNRMGWVFYAIGLLWASGHFAGEYAAFSYEERSLPGSLLAAWYGEWYWLPWLFLLLAGSFILFPDGNLPGRRWRPFGYGLLGAVVVLTVVAALDARLNIANSSVTLDNPIGISPFGDPDNDSLAFLFLILFWGSAVGSLTALVVRFRRARGDERLQMKWFVYASALLLFSFLALVIYDTASGQRVTVLDTIMLSLPPIAAGAAILKYRLYDIDVVINKTIVFGSLAAFITAVYVAIVVGIGAVLGSSNEPNLALSIAATAIVAIAFSPVKEGTQRVANRLVYGNRATPYEALARFTDEVATSYETDRVAPAMAKTIVDATGAERAEVWLALDHTLVRAATAPDKEEDTTPEAISLGADMTVPDIAGADVASEVIHNNELLGALTLTKKRGEAATPVDAKLLDDLASQAGIVLRNSRLTAELRSRLDQITRTAAEIKESRKRIVATQDKARRALERDIHDGAQQHLVALAVKLNLAKTMAKKKPERAEAMLVQLKDEATDALDTLDELAKGIYPPVLAERGIAKAIEGRAATAPFAIVIEDHTSSRFESHIEAATYFCILEALQNVAKYANAARATVTLSQQDEDLVFTVVDDGAGFDPQTTDYGTGIQGMADRLAAVGGTIDLTSAPGQGTTVSGTVSALTSDPL
jgi:signal transduction histidine kinase